MYIFQRYWRRIICYNLTLIVIILLTESKISVFGVNVMLQSNSLVKVKGRTRKGRQMNIDRNTDNTFIGKVTEKWGHRQK